MLFHSVLKKFSLATNCEPLKTWGPDVAAVRTLGIPLMQPWIEAYLVMMKRWLCAATPITCRPICIYGPMHSLVSNLHRWATNTSYKGGLPTPYSMQLTAYTVTSVHYSSIFYTTSSITRSCYKVYQKMPPHWPTSTLEVYRKSYLAQTDHIKHLYSGSAAGIFF